MHETRSHLWHVTAKRPYKYAQAGVVTSPHASADFGSGIMNFNYLTMPTGLLSLHPF